jgi:hypothetical protein
LRAVVFRDGSQDWLVAQIIHEEKKETKALFFFAAIMTVFRLVKKAPAETGACPPTP